MSDVVLGIPLLAKPDHRMFMAGAVCRPGSSWTNKFELDLHRLNKGRGWHYMRAREGEPVPVTELQPGDWIRAIISSAVDPATLLGPAPRQIAPWRPYSITRDPHPPYDPRTMLRVPLYSGRSRVVRRSDGAVMWNGQIGGGLPNEWQLRTRAGVQSQASMHDDWIAAPEWARMAVVEGLLADQALRQRMTNKAADRRERARR